MENDPQIPPLENKALAGAAPPILPPVAGAVPAPPLPKPDAKPGGGRSFVAFVLSLCLVLFLLDGCVALADDVLALASGQHILSIARELVGLIAVVLAMVVYGVMAFTPLVPKRLFLPLTLYFPFSVLIGIPAMIFMYDRMPQVEVGISLLQVVLGLGVLRCVVGGFKWRWPLVAPDRLAGRGFSWLNLGGFVLGNVFVLLPAVVAYFAVCAAMAVNHFTDGFLKLRPGGLTAEARKYVRDDGKTIELYPMAHVADSDFYHEISESFPSNSIVLMEGVTDSNHLLTNKLSYKRMAAALGLGEQHEQFKPKPGEGKWVAADVDIKEFTPGTISLLNMVMSFHSKGFNPQTIVELFGGSDPVGFEHQIFDDLLNKRNAHLLGEIQSRLPQTENIIIPWGAAHMPGISKGIEKLGFHLEKTHDYVAIRFGSGGKEPAGKTEK